MAPDGADSNLMAYHVLHEGRRMGPYDRRTIVGLRIKKTLTSGHQLEASDGSRLTVADLIGRGRERTRDSSPMRSVGSTSARLTCSATVIGCEPGPVEIPQFRGEVELRVDADMLRIAGEHRNGLRVRDGRVKLPIRDISHARVAGALVDLWLRNGDAPVPVTALQRLTLDLASESAARDLVRWMPDAQPWPKAEAAAPMRPAPNASVSPLLWASVIGIVMVAGLILLVVLRRRF